jgi:phage shock protein A
MIDGLAEFAMREIGQLRQQVTALEAKVERLRVDKERLQEEVLRLEPHRKAAEYHERQQQRELQVEAEIKAGVRCGQGYLNCNGGPSCDSDHK